MIITILFTVIILLLFVIISYSSSKANHVRDLNELKLQISALEARNNVLTSANPNLDNYVAKDIHSSIVNDLLEVKNVLTEGINDYMKDNIRLHVS